MCFYKHPKHPQPKVAKQNIPCYKVLSKTDNEYTLTSLVRGYKYNLNVLYKRYPHQLGKDFVEGTRTIDKGFHSYTTAKQLKYNTHLNPSRVVIKCYIPKGAKYWLNPKKHEFVSNQIILKEIIKLNEN